MGWDPLDEEMRFHLERQVVDYVREGMSPEEARRRAMVEFGGIELAKEECRDLSAWTSLEQLWQDVCYGARTLSRSPGFTLAAVFSLALGIGANTAVFSVVDSVLIRPLPFRAPEQLVTVWSMHPDHRKYGFTIPDYRDYRDQSRLMDGLAAYASWNANLAYDAAPERVQGFRVSGSFFQMAGVKALLGRTLTAEDDVPGRPKVVVLTNGLWRRRFGADAAMVGKTLLLNQEQYTVVGVLAASFVFPNRSGELFVPLIPDADPLRAQRNSVSFLRVIGRMKAGVSAAQANGEMDRIAARLARAYPEEDGHRIGVLVRPLREEIVGNTETLLVALLGAVTLVLLAACANVAGFLLSRASARRKETAIRVALGASGRRLLSQFLAESLLLCGAGGAVGFLAAYCFTDALLALSPADLPRTAEVRVDVAALLWTAAVSLFCGLAVGVLPALDAFRTGLNAGLRGEGRGATAGTIQNRGRQALVVAEVALSFTLLVGAGLLLRSLWNASKADPGFRAGSVLSVRLSLPSTRYMTRGAISDFHDKLVPRLASLPGVRSAGTISILPLSNQLWTVPYEIVGRPAAGEARHASIYYNVADAGYFRAMGIPLVRGREFSDHDTAESVGVAVISRGFAERHWPGGNAVGSQVRLDDVDYAGGRTVEIVGVAADIKLLTMDADAPYCVYIPLRQAPDDAVRFLANNHFAVIATELPPAGLERAVLEAVRAVDAGVAASGIKPMEWYVASALATRRFTAGIVTLFAAAAVVLALTGLYAVLAFAVTQRTREIGIRMALGASRREILRLVMGQALGWSASGIAVGLAGAWLVARAAGSLLYGSGAYDPVILGGVVVMFLGAAGAAGYLPARRATRIDPLMTLRGE